jgi:hypothetical protein
MIVKIYKKIGKNKKSKGRRELTLTRIVLHHNKIFRVTRPKRKRNGMNIARTRQDQALPLFYSSWDHTI